jgi:hypothetical protein
MLNKIASFALILALTTISFQTAFAKSSNDWNSVVGLLNKDIAVQETGGQTTFGILRSANDNEIVIEVAEKYTLSSQPKTVLRSEVRKVWRAELRFGGRNTGKGAAIGAGAGVVAAAISISKPENRGDGQAVLAIPVYTFLGAGIGAIVGFFAKKGHKKMALVYEN